MNDPFQQMRASLGDPYGLTVRQAEIIDAILRHGTFKAAARELGLSNKTITNTISQTRRKLGVKTNLHALIAWDRCKRSN